MDKFSIRTIYIRLRGDFTKVPWRRLVCNNAGLPKWIFTLYLVAHRRLLTKDRLRRWGCLDDAVYPICNTEEEKTIDHLFFSCSYSSQVWTAMLEWQGIHRQVMPWEHGLAWAERHYTKKNSRAKVYRMTLAGSMYYIWQERNGRIFQANQKIATTISRSLTQDIHCRGNLKQRLKRRQLELNYYPTVQIDV
nr:uncharacterized protein LOC104102448 [Nicotiana tomentosiformis]